MPSSNLIKRAANRLVGDKRPMVDRLKSIRQAAERYIQQSVPTDGPVVLWAQPFANLKSFWVHDGLLSLALRLRGCTVVPFVCGGAHPFECSVHGGTWSGAWNADYGQKRVEYCRKCSVNENRMWSEVQGLQPLSVVQFTTLADWHRSTQLAYEIPLNEISSLEVDGLPLGRWAVETAVNQNLVASVDQLPDWEIPTRTHLSNLFLLKDVFPRILSHVNPDRVVSHDNFYYPWSLYCELVGRSGRNYFSYYFSDKKSWFYAFNQPAVDFDLSTAWSTFQNTTLSAGQEQAVDDLLDRRSKGKAYSLEIDKGRLESDEEGRVRQFMTSGRPTAVLTANVIWDAAALGKSVTFSSMIDWAIETVRYFSRHPEWQLVVKAHPVEQSSQIPETRQKLLEGLFQALPEMPENVLCLGPKAGTTIYDLLPRCDLGLIFTSTAGLEMAGLGIPVISVARSPWRGTGITVDPDSPESYFEAISHFLSTPEGAETGNQRKELTRKYLYLRSFVYQVDFGWSSATWGKEVELLIRSWEELLPGRNPKLDHVCNSIMADLPVLSADRFPPVFG